MPEKVPEKLAGGGIMERLASLQKHGEEEWRKKVAPSREDPALILTRAVPRPQEPQEPAREGGVQLRAGRGAGARPVSLGDRLSKLQGAQTQWQKKVGEKDTEKFTVAGKMERDKQVKSVLTPSTPSTPEVRKPSLPSLPRLREEGETAARRSPAMAVFRGRGAGDGPNKPRPVSLFAEPSSSLVATSAFQRVGSYRKPSAGPDPSLTLQQVASRTVALPEQDQELIESFFPSPTSLAPAPSTPLTTSDFDLLSTEPLLQCRRAAVSRPRRARRGEGGNPVRSLAARQDLAREYREVTTGVAERETKRLEKEREEKGSKHAHLAEEARAGLQAKEDFSSVQLRSGAVNLPHHNLLPYREKMLIQVKGRRFCQSRLVPPLPESLNSGDCFVLVTPTQVFCWQGRFSNVIERSRSAEVALCVLQKKDMGCKAAEGVETVEEEKLSLCSRENRRFWRCLTGKEATGQVAEAGPPEQDEEYEQATVEASTVYRVDLATEQLEPLEEGWGLPPKHTLLKPDLVLVFDFGSEVYCYNGKNAPFEARKLGSRLSQDLWAAGWDYTGCAINPAVGRMAQMRVTERPDWTILGRINSCMETILFREKFTDWPDKSRLIGSRVGAAAGKKEDTPSDPSMQPWAWADLAGVSGASLAEQEVEEVDLELEGSHLGRGRGWYDLEERRNYEISNLGVEAWHVEEGGSIGLGQAWTGQFHTGDTYVVRWNYKVALTGRALKGGASKHSAVGRERVAYFFWQGAESATALQGASALQCVELDSEKGPQLRVAEGREHAAFLQLWDGAMTVFSGRRAASSPSSTWRLFVLQGELPEETFLTEVAPAFTSLRARGVFLLLSPAGRIFLWLGSCSSPHQVAAGRERAAAWVRAAPSELGASPLEVEVVEQGAEPALFWEGVGGRDGGRFPPGCARLESNARLFHCSSVLGEFQALEIRPDWVNTGTACQLLHSQARLYTAEQPALFMFDFGTVLYLWQGWQAPESEEEGNPNLLSGATGSGEVRWHAERRAAMATLLEYRRARYGHPVPRAELVWAGHEPQEFCHLFPVWRQEEEAVKANEQCVSSPDLEATFSLLSRTSYSWEELQQRPLPHGVDPARIEAYLDTLAFQEKFSMSKAEYSASPRWKQIEMKKEAGLF